MTLRWKDDANNGNLKQLKIYWRTVLEPDDKAPFKVRVTKQASLWGKVKLDPKPAGKDRDFVWRRYDSRPCDISDKVTNNSVTYNRKKLEFNGTSSYLVIDDPGLTPFATAWELNEEDFGNRSEPEIVFVNQVRLFGINIRIEMDIKVDGDQDNSPIFVRRLPDEVTEIKLCTTRAGLQYQWHLDVPAHEFMTETYELTDGAADKRFHTITVQQDGDRSNTKDYFEFYVDELQLYERFKSGKTKSGPPFSTKKSQIYIGHEPGTDNFFKGFVKRLMFDPNASCPGCT